MLRARATARRISLNQFGERRLVLGGLAEFERELFRARTADGRALARARDQHVGRPAKLSPIQWEEVWRLLAAGAERPRPAQHHSR